MTADFTPRPRVVTKDLNQACTNAVRAMLRHAQTAEMLTHWLELASASLVECGFTLRSGAVVATGQRIQFGQEVSRARQVRDSVTQRPMSVRVSLQAFGDEPFFGRAQADVSLHCITSRGPSGRAAAHELARTNLLLTLPEPDLIRFGGLSERLRQHVGNALQARYPQGMAAVFKEFAALVGESLAP